MNYATIPKMLFLKILASCFLLPTYQRIFLIANGSAFLDFDADEIIYVDAFVYPIFGDIYDAGSECDFLAPDIPLFDNIRHFILIRQSDKCTPAYQISNAVSRGIKNIIIGSDWNIIKQYKPYLKKTSKETRANIAIISVDKAKFLSKYTYTTKTIIYITLDKLDGLFLIFLPLIIVACVVTAIMIIFGLMILTKCLIKKIKKRRDRIRIYKLPTRKCTEDDIIDQCPICFDEYVLNDLLTVLRCGHEYHQSCLGLWTGGDCPLCRCSMFDKSPISNFHQTNDLSDNQGQYDPLIGHDSQSENILNVQSTSNSIINSNSNPSNVVNNLIFPIDQEPSTSNPICINDKILNDENDCSLII